MTTTAEILQKARDLISDEKNWNQGDYGRASGKPVGIIANQRLPTDTDCFCAVGAIAWVSDATVNEAERSAAWKFLNAETNSAEMNEIHEFNDTHTHAEVLDLFDRAIKRAISAEEA